MAKMLCMKTWERNLYPWMHRLDTEAGNAQVLHLWEEPKIVNQVQAKWRKRARRYVLGGTYIKWERLYFTLLFLPLRGQFQINLTSMLFKEPPMEKENYKRFSSTLGTCKNLPPIRYKASSKKRHRKYIYCSLGRYLETSRKVTTQSWHLDVFNWASKLHYYEKSKGFPLESTPFPADMH